MKETYYISDAAKEVKVESHVLRYWEDELKLPIKRNELGHRYYTRADVELFRKVKELKERGLQLKAIKSIMDDGRLEDWSTGNWYRESGKEQSTQNGEDKREGMEERKINEIQEGKEKDGKQEGMEEQSREEGNTDLQESENGRPPRTEGLKGEELEEVRKRVLERERYNFIMGWERLEEGSQGERQGVRQEGQGERREGERQGGGQEDGLDEKRGDEMQEEKRWGEKVMKKSTDGNSMETEILGQEGLEREGLERDGLDAESHGMGIMILESRDINPSEKEEKARRIQSLLRQIIQETVRESSQEICREIKNSVLKELDYQFRIQEERLEEREEQRMRQSEEYYRRMDELLREKSGRDGSKKGVKRIWKRIFVKKTKEYEDNMLKKLD